LRPSHGAGGRLSSAIDVRQSCRGADVAATLERVAIETSLPKTIRVDNGREFVSKELDLWAFIRGVALEFSRPGKPPDNAFIESFYGQFRSEPKRQLVPEPRRSSAKMRGLA
jgi:putative transposase